MKKLAINLIRILTLFLFGMALYIMVFGTIAVTNNRLINIFGYSYAVVPTSSMEGDLPDSLDVGDMIIIRLMPIEQAQAFDIAVFYSNEHDRLIVHRIIEITENNELITKGDNVILPDDELVTSDMFYGIVLTKVTALGVGNLSLNYRNVIFAIIIILLLFVLFREVRSIFKNMTAKEEEKLKNELEIEKKKMLDEQRQEMLEMILKEQKEKDKNVD